MSKRSDGQPDIVLKAGNPLTRGLRICIAGVLVTGGIAGLLVNRPVVKDVAADSAPGHGVVLAAREPLGGASVSTADRGSQGPVVAAAGVLRFRKVEITAPADPFQPAAGASVPAAGAAPPPPVDRNPAAPGTAISGTGGAVTNQAIAVRAAGPKTAAPAAQKAAAAPVAAGAKPSAEEIHLGGVITGDPMLAVVHYSGQTLFLKVGDQVADTWRLEAIKDRSAIFQLGEQRVEIPIRGGSSQ